MDRNQIAPSAKIEKMKKIGMAITKTTATANTTPTRGLDAPSKVPPDSKLPETPELSEIQAGNIRWSISDEGEQYKYEHGYETLI